MTIKQLSISRLTRWASGTRWYLAISGTLAVVACSSPPEPPTHQTVEFYRANKEARQAKLAECENDPGALGNTPDCINAKQAAKRDMKTLRDLPPLNLPGATPNPGSPRADEQRPNADHEQGEDR